MDQIGSIRCVEWKGRRAQKLRRKILILVLLFLLLPAVQAEKLHKGMRFQTARRLLLRQGWTPVSAPRHEEYVYGLVAELLKAHIVEVEGCAVDKPYCIFHYTKGRECLRILTEGEAMGTLRISAWSGECYQPD